MKRRRRSEILVEGDPALRGLLASKIEATYPVQTIEPPRDGLVMIRMREGARSSLFYLGELLVTEARVRVAGAIGLGVIAGDNEEAARQLALIDAAYNAALPETEQWTPLLEEEEQRLRSERAAREEHILETKVRFDTMEAQ